MIEIQGLSFGYRRTTLYQAFDLDVTRPGVYGLFGRNGSGKSTLLKLLSGLLFPDGGRITLGGREPRRRQAEFLAQVYLVPEEFHLPDLSPDDLLRTHAGFYPRFSAAAFRDYLAEFELPHDRRFGEMSLGQKKKAVMAFALATFTPVLLLDEPTNGMDIVGRDQFKAIVARPEQRERIIVISTHQAHDLERIMDHMLFIDAATLALSATREELARALVMGVAADDAALAAIPGLIHHEALGAQHAYVARNTGDAAGAVHLELLYKALSLKKDGVLAALSASKQEASHV
ncbi:MAG TPA: ABC transporter ATP-binding protein [Arenimonas sp.]|uniref:ABC transporter ATP-binding protein n=1 Tax=Arenimonas sp. TaxID=1872635 RepID=UPI002D81019F|nr:ABC transporter ATP-binding protein [Arenimonas sp.]HEU0152666.1 ABC transporter ATP-binding protein [Arenimonas sp.]